MRQGQTLRAFFLSLFLFLLSGLSAARAEADIVVVETNSGNHSFGVELALTPEARARGMMFRTELAPDKGMLFIFPDSDHRSFWMKNTFIPLDIIFIKRNGRIANIVANAEPETLTQRRSKGRAVAVLEIQGGRAAELGIRAGDLVRHERLGTAGAQ